MNIIKRYMHTKGNDMEERSKGRKREKKEITITFGCRWVPFSANWASKFSTKKSQCCGYNLLLQVWDLRSTNITASLGTHKITRSSKAAYSIISEAGRGNNSVGKHVCCLYMRTRVHIFRRHVKDVSGYIIQQYHAG